MALRPATAIILAAGSGGRFRRDHEVLKGLLPLPLPGGGATTLLRRASALLGGAGVTDVRVVVRRGTHGRISTVAPACSTVQVALLPGAFGSATSLLRGLEALGGPDVGGVLVLDGDIVFERPLLDAVMAAVLRAPRPTLFAVGSTRGDGEEVRVYADPASRAPRVVAKAPAPAVVDGLELLGESTGIIFIPGDAIPAVRREIVEATGQDRRRAPTRSVEHEEIWQALCDRDDLDAVVVDEALGFPPAFGECDDDADYQHLLRTVWPAVLAADARGPGQARSSSR